MTNNLLNNIKIYWNELTKGVIHPKRSRAIFQTIVDFYSESHRQYHTLSHLNWCFDKYKEYYTVVDPGLNNHDYYSVAFSLFFHDIIYQPLQQNNELRSSELALAVLYDYDHEPLNVLKIANLIELTSHKYHPASITSEEAKIVLDVDLSILGANEVEFNAFESGIRFEYSFVQDEIYKEKRVEILESFLNLSRIYHTDFFFNAYEKQARNNLEQLIQKLRS